MSEFILPTWFILIPYIMGGSFIYLGCRLWFEKQIKLLGSYANLKRKQDKDLVCKFSGIYAISLGLFILVVPVINLYQNLMNIFLMILIAMVLSVVFWQFLSKKFFSKRSIPILGMMLNN